MSHKKFGPDRFSRFDVYWIQTNRQTDRQAKFIYRCLITIYSVQLLFLDLQANTLGQGLGFYVYIKIGLKLENPITNKSACRPLCANGDYLYFNQIYSIWLETLGAFKVVIFRSTIESN